MAKAEKPAKFNMVWRNLDRALSMPIFSKFEIALMQIARELSYTASVVDGSGRAKPFRIFPTKVAQRRGMCREEVSRAIAMLLKDNVWKGTRDRLRINKNYREWTGKHQLTDEQIRECDDALDYPVTNCGEVVHGDPDDALDASMDHELPCEPGLTPEADSVSQDSHSIPQSVSQDSQSCEPGLTLYSAKCEPGLTAQNPPLEPPVERARKTENPERVRVEVVEEASTSAINRDIPIEELRRMRPFRPGEGEVHRLQDWAMTVGPNGDILAQKIRGFVSSYPIPWIEDAILCGVAGAGPGGEWKYAHKCLLNWWAKGGRDHEEITKARENLAAPKKPTYSERNQLQNDAIARAAAILGD